MADALTPEEVPALAAAFGRALHDAGLPSSPERSVRFARALQVARPTTRSGLYWTARAVFVSGREQVSAFDALFAVVFDGAGDPADERGDATAPNLEGAERGERRPRHGAPEVDAPPADGGGRPTTTPGARDDDAPERDVPVPVASAHERLAGKDFAALEPDELLALRRLMRDLEIATPLRRSRRARRNRRGDRLDVRATLRASRRTGGDPVRQVRRRRVRRHRKLVVLCDISGSMEP
ncbi:MAG: uncharacterized protein QOH43_372, partial [Solirubrobacteraceae bacterium]|nr:uncharacterized protein [Solirubrobacteraceae bacterium]